MKALFFISILANLLIEAGAGISLLAGDQGISSGVRPDYGPWSIHYGFAAIAVASVSIWLWLYRFNIVVMGVLLGFLATFNTLLFLSVLLAGGASVAMAFHGFMAIACSALYLRKTGLTWSR